MNAMPTGTPKMPRACRFCGQPYTLKGAARKHCTEACYFLDNVNRTPGYGANWDWDCWLWTGPIYKRNEYGKFSQGSTQMAAHRWAYEFFIDDIPTGLWVLHRCDVILCVYPRHLFLGTTDNNMADMVAKGRSARGEKHHKAKLTEDDVRNIRAAWNRGFVSQVDLAIQYGVRPGNIWAIVTGKTWKHVK